MKVALPSSIISHSGANGDQYVGQGRWRLATWPVISVHLFCHIPITERTLPTFLCRWPDEFASVISAVPTLFAFIDVVRLVFVELRALSIQFKRKQIPVQYFRLHTHARARSHTHAATHSRARTPSACDNMFLVAKQILSKKLFVVFFAVVGTHGLGPHTPSPPRSRPSPALDHCCARLSARGPPRRVGVLRRQVYRAIGGHTKIIDKYNSLIYFQTLCCDTQAANLFINRCAGGGGGVRRGRGAWVLPLSPSFFPGPWLLLTTQHHFWGGGGRTNQHNPRYANYWATLTHKRHPPHPAQPQHTDHGAPQTRKQHQQEHRPQRPTERSDPTQHAKGRTGDCPGPRKETATRRNVTQGVGGGSTDAFVWGGERGGGPRAGLCFFFLKRKGQGPSPPLPPEGGGLGIC